MSELILDFLNSSDFDNGLIMFSGLFLFFWFMGFGISYIISIFIKIIGKGV